MVIYKVRSKSLGNFLISSYLLLVVPQFCLPLLMEKLSSDIVDAKIDALLTLVSNFFFDLIQSYFLEK